MKIDNINTSEAISNVKGLLEKEKGLSPAFRSAIILILFLMQVMLDHLSLNSKNSSKPPSSDPNRKKSGKKRGASKRKPGGQAGRVGKQLKPVKNPDKIEVIEIDKRTLPKGNYSEAGFEARQVVDFKIAVHVTEYRAQVLVDGRGARYIADFPSFVTRPIQYGPKTKASSVYMSQFQLIPYKRIEDYFFEQVGLNLSAGSIFNFNKEAYDMLEKFEQIAKERLINSSRVNADETGVNINGKRLWLHTTCNGKWTHFYSHQKRGSEAMGDIGIIPKFQGVLCHDHWKPYFKYHCSHALCNAHHLRELEWSGTEDKQKWAGNMMKFLKKLNKKVDDAGGQVNEQQSDYYRKRYTSLLAEAEIECPAPDVQRKKGQRGRMKKSKSRNLLERLIDYKEDVLRFIDSPDVPFTNNQGENDLRMTKVQQKISGCFRSIEGAYMFCRIRAYLITCRKHDVSATDALELLFQGDLPDFICSG
jgi:transposase